MEKEVEEKLVQLKVEQKKLAKQLSLKNAFDFSLAEIIAGCYNAFLPGKIISAIVICKNFDVIEQQYVVKKLAFPYIAGFRAYRELPAMIECYQKLEEQPDFLFVNGHGIAHPRMLGLASHFSLAINRPTIGIAKNLLVGKVKKGKIYLRNKIVGVELLTKEGSKPIYVSPGNMITLKTALELTRKFIRAPHKLPEPLVQAKKLVNSIIKELQKD